MVALLWNLSTAIRGYLRFYMPTNRALNWLRTPRGLAWAVPIALIAVPIYAYALSVAAVVAEKPGFGWVNVLVILFAWNALKLLWAAALSLPLMLCDVVRRGGRASA